MAKTLSEQETKVHVADIVHHGEKITLPENMSVSDAINILERRQEYLEEEIKISEKFKVFPWDGAHALQNVLAKRYGWASAEPTPGFFGSRPPEMMSVDVDYNKVVSVPWGRFSLPAISGFIQCDYSRENGRVIFAISARILRKDEQAIQSLFDELRTELLSNSIYRGKAFKMRFRDEDGDLISVPEPKFLDTNDVDESMMVYSDNVQRSIETNLFTPILRVADCKENGIPVKRGVLLGGTYGTGKTMAAKVASKYAVQSGVTYLYVPRVNELADAVEFAKMYCDPACVIFCEDIDRAMDGGRTVEMDDILNIIDGIDTKSANIIVVLTTNHLDNINPAMLRPGRLDAVIDVTPPDQKAVEKLLRAYGGESIAQDVDLSEPSKILAGRIPAVIAEVVKRAKLTQLSLQAPGTKVTSITSEALCAAAQSMEAQLELLYRDREAKPVTIDSLVQGYLKDAVADTQGSVSFTEGKVKEIHERIC